MKNLRRVVSSILLIAVLALALPGVTFADDDPPQGGSNSKKAAPPPPPPPPPAGSLGELVATVLGLLL